MNFLISCCQIQLVLRACSTPSRPIPRPSKLSARAINWWSSACSLLRLSGCCTTPAWAISSCSGLVSDRQLQCLLTGARALLFLSHYEGFGIPIVEAFASGTPVVCYSSSAMPEVASDAAALHHLQDVAGVAASMDQLAEDEAWRQVLISRGGARLEHFSWERAAHQVREVYRQAHQLGVLNCCLERPKEAVFGRSL